MWLFVFPCFWWLQKETVSHVHACTVDKIFQSTMVYFMKRIKCRHMILRSADEVTES